GSLRGAGAAAGVGERVGVHDTGHHEGAVEPGLVGAADDDLVADDEAVRCGGADGHRAAVAAQAGDQRGDDTPSHEAVGENGHIHYRGGGGGVHAAGEG